MPQCICGCWFQQQSYKIDADGEDNLCGGCKSVSNPQSYVNSHEWVGEHTVATHNSDYD